MMSKGEVKQRIRQLLPQRPIVLTIHIDPKTDEYLWRLSAQHRIPAGTLAAFFLYSLALKDAPVEEILVEVEKNVQG